MLRALASDAGHTGAHEDVIRVYRRADAAVHVLKTPMPEGGWRLTVFGPGNAQEVHDGLDAAACGAKVLEVERQLFSQGFQTDARDAA